MAKSKKKKELVVPQTKADMLVARLNANSKHAQAYTATKLADTWRYVDFVNPTAQLPCIALEWLLGCRGLLAGRILQLRATYSKGKSSFMFLTYAAAQLMSDAFCYHVETEGAAAPPDYIASFGCDPDNLVMDELSSLEECLGRLDEVIAQVRGGFGGSVNPATGKTLKTKYTDPLDPDMNMPIVAGIDSLSSLGLMDNVDEDIADLTKRPQISGHSLKLRDYFRRRSARFKQTQTLLMLTSHETAKIETGKRTFGGPKKTSLAQEAIGIHATYILDVAAKKYTDKDSGVQLGDIVTLTTGKNKLSPKNRILDTYLVWNKGFDLVKTDVEFLLNHGASPFTKDELYRHSRGRLGSGITCKPLSDKAFASDEEFLRAFYNNQDLVMSIREKMRIRGCGFDFETKYKPSQSEIEDNLNSEESDIDGVAASSGESSDQGEAE
jgi:hypothetical protein